MTDDSELSDSLVRIDDEQNVYLSFENQYQMIEDCLPIGVTHVVVVPWAGRSSGPAWNMFFNYHLLPGHLKNNNSMNRMNQYLEGASNFICDSQSNTSEKNKVVICDDCGGYSGAAFMAMAYLIIRRGYTFDDAKMKMRVLLKGRRVEVTKKMIQILRNRHMVIGDGNSYIGMTLPKTSI